MTDLALQDIECAVNLQHDCHFGKCGPHSSASVAIRQEREETSITRACIRHSDEDRFIVNMASLHNYHQISSALPTSLTAHSFTVKDQTALRVSAAAQIRDKIDGHSDDPMSLIATCEAADLEMVTRGDNAEEPDGEPARTEPEPRPATETVAVLNAPVFSRVGAGARARKQQLKEVPTTL